MTFTIRPAAPVPEKRTGAKYEEVKKTTLQLEPGQSFLVPLNGEKRQQVQLCSVLSALGRNYYRKFATRREADGIAIWRVE